MKALYLNFKVNMVCFLMVFEEYEKYQGEKSSLEPLALQAYKSLL